MAADLEDRSRLAANADFLARVTGAVLVYANTVGGEAIPAGQNAKKYERRTDLIHSVLTDLGGVAARFARAAAGSTAIANAFADAATAAPGTPAEKDVAGVNAVLDAAISTYVAAAWDVIAGVQPTER